MTKYPCEVIIAQMSLVERVQKRVFPTETHPLPRNELSVTPENIAIEVIDEGDRANIFSNPQRNIDLTRKTEETEHMSESTEGFAQNSQRQIETARFIIERFNIIQRGPLLDVGFGGNLNIAATFVQSGIDAFAIDGRRHPGWIAKVNSGSMGFNTEVFWDNPVEREVIEGVRICSGDIVRIAEPGSDLVNHRFGLILFYGSWTSGSCNFTIEDRYKMAEQYIEEELRRQLVKPIEDELYSRRRDAFQREPFERRIAEATKRIEQAIKQAKIPQLGKEATLRVLPPHLAENGLIGFVSSRYSYRGGGYCFEDLPQEKSEFIDLYRKLVSLGATKIYLIGISSQNFEQIIRRSLRGGQKQKRKDKLSLEEAMRVKRILDSDEFVPTPEFKSLARIDALFAELS